MTDMESALLCIRMRDWFLEYAAEERIQNRAPDGRFAEGFAITLWACRGKKRAGIGKTKEEAKADAKRRDEQVVNDDWFKVPIQGSQRFRFKPKKAA